MSARPTDLNCPLPAQICDANGRLTLQGVAFLRRLWERTGYAPGTDAAWTAQEADIACLAAAVSQQTAANALLQAQEALSEIRALLIEIQGLRAQAIQALKTAQDSAIISATARVRDGSNSDESMIFTIMKT